MTEWPGTPETEAPQWPGTPEEAWPGTAEPAEPSEGFLSRLMDGFTKTPTMVEPEGMSSVISRLPDIPGDTWDFFKSGASMTAAAPGQLLGVTPSSQRQQIEEGLRSVGFTPEQAKAEAKRAHALARSEAIGGLLFGPGMMLMSPAFGAFRSLVSRPLEEQTGIPQEATEAAGMVAGGLHVMARVRVGADGRVSTQPVGDLPQPPDFRTAADVLGSPAAEASTRQLWEERGIHPAEAVHDAQFDAFDKQQIAPPSIRVFHGSPHEFERFDVSKIGTGEGAQAFGHGLYFAENEGVARQYQGNLARPSLPGFSDVERAEAESFIRGVRRDLDAHEKDPAEIRDRALKEAEIQDQYASDGDQDAAQSAALMRKIAALSDAGLKPQANIYQVIIHADPEHFLDWDKPLSEQSEQVKAAIQRIAPEYPMRKAGEEFYLDFGRRVYLRQEAEKPGSGLDHHGPTSQALREAGIPGIKYLDQGSRTAGEGSRNYVLFDDTLAEITHKNGTPLIPTKTSPVVGSVVPRGTPRSELAKTGQPHIDSVLDHPVVKRAIDNAVVDDTHTIGNSWGASDPPENPTLFLDKEFPRSLTVDGVTFDPAEPAAVHENPEQFAIRALMRAGWSRAKALSAGFWGWGEPAEDAWYTAHGIDHEHAEAALAPIVDRIAGRKPPAPPEPPKNNPLEMARRGELSADRAKEIAVEYEAADKAFEDKVLGADAEPWRKAWRRRDRLWDQARDNEARAQQKIMDDIEAKYPADQIKALADYLENAPRHGTPESWRDVSSRLRDVEGDRNDAVSGLAYEMRRLPDPKKRLYDHDYDTLAVIQHALTEENKRGGEPEAFLRDAIKQGIKQYGGGADAMEVMGHQMKELKALMENPPQALPSPNPFADIPPELFRDTYPDGDPSKAAPGPIPKLTDAEMTQAKAIIAAEIQRTAQPAGAAVTPPAMLANLPPYSVQPPPPRGSLVAAGKQAVDDMFALGRNLQGMLDPMSMGSPRAMVVAKDAMNAVRRIRWEHLRLDQEIMQSAALKAARDRLGETQQEQLARMWTAGDEESVLRQTTGSNPNMGWATLEPEERTMMEYVDGLGRDSWMLNISVGNVEGEGLPAWMPRALINMAMVGEGSPRALNELGRNVFTRTANMLHRKHLMAEDTEAAAKEVIRKRMDAAGASPAEIAAAVDKVSIGRNFRALPLAIARMNEAAVWTQMINHIEEIGRATGTMTVSVGDKPPGWFTIEGNPAFTKWGPRLEKNPVTGTWAAVTNDAGEVIFDGKPRYLPAEYKGPMLSILDDGPRWMDPNGPNPYGALMALKGKAMTAILNSPLIHNEVVWGKVMEAAGGREWLGFGLYFRGNRLVNSNPGRAGELIEHGLNPMGPRGAIQDITGLMEEPNLAPGRSWTAQIARVIPDLFDPARPGQTVGGPGDKVAAAIDKMGDFWHNTLLWDRVRDVQFGLADHMSDKLVAKGLDRLSADRIATHFANIIVGSIPKEAMSASARMTANLLLFSRSFTLGNLSTFKQAAVGLPKPVLAQIARDLGMPVETLTLDDPAAAAAFNAATQEAKSFSRWKAINTIALSIALYYAGNALFQHAFNIAQRDSTLNDEMQGYARRFSETMEAVRDDPFEIYRALARLSPTWDNEPGKSDRFHAGYDKDGTGIYGRLPFGKFGEELTGYAWMNNVGPGEMIKRKLSPMAGSLLESFWNDKGFGGRKVPIYDETDKSAMGKVKMALAIGKHMAMRELPEGQIMAGIDLLRDEGDPTVNKLRLVGPALGFTASVGYPGGPLKGEVADEKRNFEARFELAWPDIKRQVQRGDVAGATQAMMNLGTPMREIRGRLQAAMMPGNISGRALNDFFSRATPEQQQRFFNAPRAP